MHEYSLVHALFDQLSAQAAARGATSVRKVTVGMGELAGVDPELFQTAFQTFRGATPFPEVELSLRWVPARWVCPRCAQAFKRGAVLRCQECGGLPARLAAGDELTLERIEMEVPESQALRDGVAINAPTAG
jgi:hydrogenase nickel incorporation protein HypA/HybF